MAAAGDDVFSPAWRAARAYQPFFCEENVWRMLGDGVLPEPGAAMFVTNRASRVAMWGQRAAARDPIVWDYHVVAWLPQRGVVVDLDDRAQLVWPLQTWLAHAFRSADRQLQPSFRVVPREELLATFSSDRRHMRGDGGRELHPFPPWSAPFRAELGHTLPRFLDLDDGIAGCVTDLAGAQRLAAP